MKDTQVEVEQKYREMLLARSGEERLRIGCSMHATAQALVRAFVLAENPLASPGELRRALFLRFYGHEFDASARERIAARLDRDAPSTHTSRRVPVNWDDLEMALTTNPGEWTCYLDVRSGEVQMVPLDHFADDEEGPSEEEIEAALEARHLIHVEPLDSCVEYGWMAEFSETVGNARLRERLEVALDGRGPFRRFKNVLLDHPAERDRWFAFRGARVREAARKWLAEEGIEPTTAPRPRHRG